MLQGSGQDQGNLQLPLGQWWEGLGITGLSGCGTGHKVVLVCPEAAWFFPGTGHSGVSAGLWQGSIGPSGPMAGVAQTKMAAQNVGAGSFSTVIKIHKKF